MSDVTKVPVAEGLFTWPPDERPQLIASRHRETGAVTLPRGPVAGGRRRDPAVANRDAVHLDHAAVRPARPAVHRRDGSGVLRDVRRRLRRAAGGDPGRGPAHRVGSRRGSRSASRWSWCSSRSANGPGRTERRRARSSRSPSRPSCPRRSAHERRLDHRRGHASLRPLPRQAGHGHGRRGDPPRPEGRRHRLGPGSARVRRQPGGVEPRRGGGEDRAHRDPGLRRLQRVRDGATPRSRWRPRRSSTGKPTSRSRSASTSTREVPSPATPRCSASLRGTARRGCSSRRTSSA